MSRKNREIKYAGKKESYVEYYIKITLAFLIILCKILVAKDKIVSCLL
jgi:hypothetical protein